MFAVNDFDSRIFVAPVLLYLVVILEKYITDIVAMEHVFQM